MIESLRLAWLANETLEEQLQYLSEHVKKSDQTAISYHEEVLLGQRNLTDLLDAKSEVNRAKKTLAEAESSLAGARFRIQEAAGQLFDVMGLDVTVGEAGMRIFNKPIAEIDRLPVNRGSDR